MTCEGQSKLCVIPSLLHPRRKAVIWFLLWISLKLTQGETVAEAMEAAKDALLTAFDFYFEDNELIPLPSPLNSHDHFIEVPLSVASKVLLLNAFLQSEITQQELARRIGKLIQERL